MGPLDLLGLATHHRIYIHIRELGFTHDFSLALAVEEDYVSAAQLIFIFEQRGSGWVLVRIHRLKHDPRVGVSVFLEQGPNRIINGLSAVEINHNVDVIGYRSQDGPREGREDGLGLAGHGQPIKMPCAQVIEHHNDSKKRQGRDRHIEADRPFAAYGETSAFFSCHGHFQRRLSTTLMVRNRKSTVKLRYNTRGRESMTPRAKSCMCSTSPT